MPTEYVLPIMAEIDPMPSHKSWTSGRRRPLMPAALLHRWDLHSRNLARPECNYLRLADWFHRRLASWARAPRLPAATARHLRLQLPLPSRLRVQPVEDRTPPRVRSAVADTAAPLLRPAAPP